MSRSLGFLWIFFLLGTVSTLAYAMDDRLTISVNSGMAPLQVQITGPYTLIADGKNTYNKWVGCGYNIDWGDASQEFQQDCSVGFIHTYKSPGTYTIKANTFHPAPDDSHVVDWTGTTTVKVE